MVTDNVHRRFRVGLVVLLALVAFGVGVFMVGRRADIFTRKVDYHIHFASASGLTQGNSVRLAGVNVGNVTEVSLSDRPGDTSVTVTVSVDRRMSSRIRTDTTAAIKTIGLLGDKYIELTGGSAGAAEVAPGGDIPAAREAGIEKLLAGGEGLLGDLTAIAQSLKVILGRTEKGEGLLGELTSRSATGDELGSNLNRTLKRLSTTLDRINSGKSLAGRLLVDEKYGKETGDSLSAALSSASHVFGKLSASLDSKNGVVSALLNDPAAKQKVYRLLDDLSQAGVSRASDAPARREVRRRIPPQPAGAHPPPRLDLREARRGGRRARQAHQRPVPLRRRQRRRRRHQRLEAPAVADPQPAEAGNPAPLRPGESAVGRALARHSMKILITGGAGFIGSHLADRRRRAGDHVTVLDDFNDFYDPRAKRANVAGHLGDPEYRLVEGDIRDRSLVDSLFETGSFDAVVHLAARAGVRPSLAAPALYEEVNCVGTIHLLEAARGFGAPKFVFASSSSVYGINSKLPFSEEDPISRPVSPYATTKRSGELLAFNYHHLYGLDLACLRFFTVYGPRQRPEMAIAKFTRAVLEGREIPFYGDGTSRRDYTYIDDILDGLEAALDRCRGFEIVNLGGSHPVTLSELVRMIELAAGGKASLRRMPDQPGDVPATYADVSKAKRLYGYEPRVPLEEGLRRYVEWVRKGSEG
jgi:UDP-glucuronate 4-epimerase